jgi:hypothetical protein
MPKKVWTIHVTGPMTRLRSDGTPVRVPEETYTMTEADSRHYEIVREGGLTFTFGVPTHGAHDIALPPSFSPGETPACVLAQTWAV